MTRRNFLKNSAKGAALLPFLSIAAANSLYGATPNFPDYKAIIVLHFNGGNDSLNMFIPTDTTKHADYTKVRKKIAVANTNLASDATFVRDNGYYKPANALHNPYEATKPANPSETDPQDNLEAIYRKGFYKFNSDPLGINGVMPELAAMYEKGVVSMVSNVGPLVKPTAKADIIDKSAELPIYLFAHDHQRRAIQTAKAQEKITTGWLGRVADAWSPQNDTMGLNVSLNGINKMLVGNSTSPLTFGNTPYIYNEGIIKNVIEKFAKTLISNNITLICFV
jgi:uncharacterized protein (DUF1501 family)